MSLFVLDTDILSLYEAGNPVVCSRCQSTPAEDLTITVISVEEQLSGWYVLLRRAKNDEQLAWVYERLERTIRFIANLHILQFSRSAIARSERLRGQRLRIGTNDLRIAAITLEAGGILVTRNTRDFSRIPGLALEDWSV